MADVLVDQSGMAEDLWFANRDMAMLALGHLLGQGSIEEEPIIVVADTTHETTRSFVWGVRAAIEGSDANGYVLDSGESIMMLILPVRLVRGVATAKYPKQSAALEQHPHGELMWVAVAEEGQLALLQVPIEPYWPEGSA